MVTPNPFVKLSLPPFAAQTTKRAPSRAPESALPLGEQVVAVNGGHKAFSPLARWKGSSHAGKRRAMNRHRLALPLIAALAACASPQGEYPSLAIRPAERATGTLQPIPVEPVLTSPSPATLDRVSQLAADGQSSHRAFLGTVAGARGTITSARGKSIGDDAWAKGEAAFADVRAARSKTMVSLADLDRLYVDAATQGEATDRIGAARDEVAALVSSEDGTIAELSGNLP
jgi:hypothetical protein